MFNKSLHVIVFGASGKLGRRIVSILADSPHHITAFVRSAPKLQAALAPEIYNSVNIHISSVYDPKSLESALPGQDVVISALGMPFGGKKLVVSDGLRAIVTALPHPSQTRLITISAFGTNEHRSLNLYTKHLRLLIPGQMKDKDRMEKIVTNSNTQWTIVRPGAYFDFLPHRYPAKVADIPPRLYPCLTRQAVAQFMVDQIESQDWLNQKPAIYF